jgi:hypothetical protein
MLMGQMHEYSFGTDDAEHITSTTPQNGGGAVRGRTRESRQSTTHRDGSDRRTLSHGILKDCRRVHFFQFRAMQIYADGCGGHVRAQVQHPGSDASACTWQPVNKRSGALYSHGTEQCTYSLRPFAPMKVSGASVLCPCATAA